MKNRTAQLICLLLLFTAGKVHASVHSDDSMRVVKLFDSMLSGSGDSLWQVKERTKLEDRIKKGNKPLGAVYYYYLGKFFFQTGQFDSIPSAIQKGQACLQGKKDERWAIKFYNLEGSYFSLLSEYEKAVDCFQKSLRLCEALEDDIQAAYINNNIANLFFSLLDYDNAHTYIKKAYKLLKNHKDDPNYASILAVYSVAESKKGSIARAENLANEALKIAEKTGDVKAKVITYYALGDIFTNQNNLQAAEENFLLSVELSEQFQLQHYTMLSSIGLLRVYMDAQRYAEAIAAGEHALFISATLKNENVLYSLKKNLARAYFAAGESERAFLMMNEAHEIFIKSADVQTRKAVNDMLLLYETEKKEKELARSKLLLARQSLESSRIKSWVLGLSGILVLLLAIGILLRVRNRSKMRQLQLEHETETLYSLIRGEEQERSRLAHELHDGIASSLTSIRYMLEGLPENLDGKNRLLRLLEETHQDTRRVAHNLAPTSVEKLGLSGALQHYVEENSTAQLQLSCITAGDTDGLPKALSLFLYRSVQELVQNALKHAEATEISVQLLVGPEEIRCSVENDGQGFDPALAGSTGGLQSLSDRVSQIGGIFEIDSNPGASFTVIRIVIPRANG